MMLRRRQRGRAVAFWFGILAAAGAVLIIVYLNAPHRLTTAAVGTGCITLVVGVARTLRLRSQDAQPMITTGELRKR